MKFFVKISFHPILLLFLCQGFINPAAGQTITLKDKISFSVNNATITEALDLLSRTTGSTFSYNPDHLSSSKLVKVDIQNRPLAEILDAILGKGMFGYRQMGNQVILYRSKESEIVESNAGSTVSEKGASGQLISNDNQQTQANPSRTNLTPPDTVFVMKVVHDTLRVTELVVRVDTVLEKSPVSGNDIFHNTVDLSKELTPVYKFDIGFSASYLLPHALYRANSTYESKLDEYKKSYSNKSFSGAAGIDLRLSYARWSFCTGAIISMFSQKLDYTYLDQTGGFYLKDTIDSYFTLDGTDKIWTYIVDSSYVSIDNHQYNYKVNNHTRYLEAPVTLQYNMGHNPILFFVKGGVIPGFFLNSEGQQIVTDGNGIVSIKEIRAKNVVLSYIVAAGVALPLGSKTTFTSNIFYRNHFSNIYKDFQIDTRYSALGINAGIIYKLY